MSICLCMIVKNEEKIIERCLNSAKDIIDYISICDTGSTDNTVSIIKNWCEKNKISGTVHHEPFKNFGYNRTQSVNLAKKTYPDSTYLLLIDADMILKIDARFNKQKLTEQQYLIMQYDYTIKYWNTRLIKTSLTWNCVGVTHEYWDSPDHPKSSKLDTLSIDDRGDGGCKSNKFERDKMLLTDGINNSETPSHLRSRYMFYLAQTEHDLQNYNEAIKWYKKRIEEGGWDEEIYYSKYKIGLCYEHLMEQSTKNSELYSSLASYYYLEAWNFRPTRAETLYHLARLYRLQGKNQIALLYALKGKEIKFPVDDILFVDFRVYDYLLDFEISICAYYVKDNLYLGSCSIKNLLKKMDQLPLDIQSTVRANSKFYLKK